MSPRERLILLLLSAVQFTHILDFMIIMPLSNTLIRDLSITPTQFSLIVSAYSYAAFATGIVAAFFIDRYDRKSSLLFGYTGFIIGTLLCGLAHEYRFLIGARILAGLFGGLIGAQVLSIVADTFAYEKRGQAMGYLMAAFSVASVAGVPLGLFLATLINWRAPFLLIVALGLLILPLTYRHLPPMRGHLRQRQAGAALAGFRIIFSSRPALFGLLLSASLMLGHFLIIPFITPYMQFNVGFTESQIPLIYVVGGAATLFSAPLAGRLADRFGKFRVFLLCTLASLPAVWAITHLPVTPFYFVLFLTAAWFVVANGRSVASQAIISNVVESRYRGAFMSINSSLQQLFIGSASVIAGYVVTISEDGKIRHYGWAGWLSIAIIACCILLALPLRTGAGRE